MSLPSRTVWDVPELFRQVLKEFESEKPMLFQISLVSRLFWAAAIPMIWDMVPEHHTTHQVLKAFPLSKPFDAVKPGGQVRVFAGVWLFHLTYCLLLQHWVEASSEARYALYATYVKAITFKTPKRRDKRLFSLLHSKPLAKILPNLRRLFIDLLDLPTDNAAFFHDAMNGLELTEFQIKFGGSLTGYDLSPLVSIITPLLQPCYRELRVFGFSVPSALSIQAAQVTEITNFIRTLPRLEDLEFENLDADFVEHWNIASQMPDMEYVLLDGKFQFEKDGASPQTGFRRARLVRLAYVPAHSALKLLKSIQSSRLGHLELYVQAGKLDDEETGLGRNLDDIERFAGTLTALRLELGSEVLRWTDLEPLLSCHKLKEIALTVFHSATLLTDEHIGLMAQAWRGLTSLKIDDPMLARRVAGVRQWTFPVATLRGLTSLAEFCPNLEEISISVWAKHVGREDPAHVGFKVKHVDLLWSVVDSTPFDTTDLIRKMWPHREGTNTRSRWERVDQIDGQKTHWQDIWADLDGAPRDSWAKVFHQAEAEGGTTPWAASSVEKWRHGV